MGKNKEQQLAITITDAINGSFNNKDFCEQMSREYRTLQADFTTLCLDWFNKLSEMYKDDNYDGRNQYACQTGSAIMQMLEDFGKRYRVDVFKKDGGVETTYYTTEWGANNYAYNYADKKTAFVLRLVIDGKYDVVNEYNGEVK